MNFTKRVLIAGLLLLSGISAVRAEKSRLVITTKSGTVAEFLIAESPVITYHDNLLNVVGGGSEISVEADQVQTFLFYPSDGSGIDTIESDGSKVSGLQPGTPVYIYTFDGKLAATFKADEFGSANLDTGNLAPGYYIVRTQDTSFKIKK